MANNNPTGINQYTKNGGTSKAAAVKAQRAANRNPTNKKAQRAALNAHFKAQADNVKNINAFEKKRNKK